MCSDLRGKSRYDASSERNSVVSRGPPVVDADSERDKHGSTVAPQEDDLPAPTIVLSDDKVEASASSADAPKGRDHELLDSEDEESIGDWEGDQGQFIVIESELPSGHHLCIPGHEILEFLEQSLHSRKKVETALKRWKDYKTLVHSLYILRRDGQKSKTSGSAEQVRVRKFLAKLLSYGAKHELA